MTEADIKRLWVEAEASGNVVRFRDHKTGKYFYPSSLEEALKYAKDRQA